MTIFGLKSPPTPHKSLCYFVFSMLSSLFFHVFVAILLQRVVCVSFRRLITTNTSVLDDSNNKTYLISGDINSNQGRQYAAELKSYEF